MITLADYQNRSLENLVREFSQQQLPKHSHTPQVMGSLRAGSQFRGTQSSDITFQTQPPQPSALTYPSYTPHLPVTPVHTHEMLPGSTTKEYNVTVTLQYVDLSQDYLCGYLTIANLTEQFPELTTFFDAELIGTSRSREDPHYKIRHSFITDKWRATPAIDEEHWCKFSPSSPDKTTSAGRSTLRTTTSTGRRDETSTSLCGGRSSSWCPTIG